MKRSGFDATRRNRNIGTERQGHGQDNRLVIPESWHEDRLFFEKLRDAKVVTRQLHSTELTFLVEPPRPGCVYSCTIDDMMTVLSVLPAEDRLHVKTFVLRQPTRKQEILSSVWGRLVYWSQLGRYSGLTVFLEAMDPNKTLYWTKSLSPHGIAELELLRRHGHQIETSRRHEIHLNLESIRNTQLYHTLPHEIGHYVQYLQNLNRGRDHRSLPVLEKEQFAQRYAEKFEQQAREANLIPFPRKLLPATLAKDGLRPEWFGA